MTKLTPTQKAVLEACKESVMYYALMHIANEATLAKAVRGLLEAGLLKEVEMDECVGLANGGYKDASI